MIACGGYYTIIQNEKNDVYVCGYNGYGQLGLGDKKNRYKFEKIECNFGKIKTIECNGYHHIVIQNEKNEIYVCGGNLMGQLGLGDYKPRDKFEKIEHNFGEIKKIACGGLHTVIQNEKNEVYTCGGNYNGQLGLGGDYEDGNKFEKIEYNFGEIKNIACGNLYTIIQNEKNEIYVCGNNGCGQLGLGDYAHRNKFEKIDYDFGKIKNIACGGYYTIIQNEKNEIYACGYNGCGQLGLSDTKSRNKFEKVEYNFGEIKNIVCGEDYIVIQNEKNEIYVCGRNMEGQLGLGDYKSRDKFEKVKYDFGKIKDIACDNIHILIQNEKNEIYVCGDNKFGQFGSNDQTEINRFEKINTDDIFEKIYNFELELNTEEIAL